jgi:hypothetical protein
MKNGYGKWKHLLAVHGEFADSDEITVSALGIFFEYAGNCCCVLPEMRCATGRFLGPTKKD